MEINVHDSISIVGNVNYFSLMFESKEKVKAIGGSILEINKEKKKEKQNGVDN